MGRYSKRVFISSPRKGLEAHRELLVQMLRRAGHLPIEMETFGAKSEDPVTVCRHRIEEADVVVVLIGPLSGSHPPADDRSFTQIEYEHARSRKKVLWIYFHKHAAVNDWERKLLDRHTVDPLDRGFEGPTDLASRVLADLSDHCRLELRRLERPLAAMWLACMSLTFLLRDVWLALSQLAKWVLAGFSLIAFATASVAVCVWPTPRARRLIVAFPSPTTTLASTPSAIAEEQPMPAAPSAAAQPSNSRSVASSAFRRGSFEHKPDAPPGACNQDLLRHLRWPVFYDTLTAPPYVLQPHVCADAIAAAISSPRYVTTLVAREEPGNEADKARIDDELSLFAADGIRKSARVVWAGRLDAARLVVFVGYLTERAPGDHRNVLGELGVGDYAWPVAVRLRNLHPTRSTGWPEDRTYIGWGPIGWDELVKLSDFAASSNPERYRDRLIVIVYAVPCTSDELGDAGLSGPERGSTSLPVPLRGGSTKLPAGP